jgi:hypothetical protein
MEFLCHASGTGYTRRSKTRTRYPANPEIRRTGQAVVAATDYDCIEIGMACHHGEDRRANTISQLRHTHSVCGKSMRRH